MKKIIVTILVILPLIGNSGQIIPHYLIAHTYAIGIAMHEDEILRELSEELKIYGYTINLVDKTKDFTWDKFLQENFDFYVFKKNNYLYLWIKSGRINNRFLSSKLTNDEYLDFTEIKRRIFDFTTPKYYEEYNDFEPSDKLMGLEAYFQGDYDRALRYLNRTTNKDRYNDIIDSDVYFYISKIYNYKKNQQKELEYLKKALYFNPYDCKIKIGLGNFYLKQKNHGKAIEFYSQCVDDEFDTFVSIYNLGQVYEQNKDLKKALILYKKIPKNSYLYGKAQKRIFGIGNKYQISEKDKFFLKDGWFLAITLVMITIGLYVFRQGKLARKKRNINKEKVNLNEEDKKLIKSYIASDRIQEAFIKAKEITTNNYIKRYDEIIGLENRWVNLNDQFRIGIIDNNHYLLERNKIINSLIKTIQN